MTNEPKKILTFTQLLDRAKRLYEKNPEEYCKAFSAGSDVFLKGMTVKFIRLNQYAPSSFNFYTPNDNANYAETYARVWSQEYRGERYTHYEIDATPSRYRKRMHKFLPVSFPEGMKTRANAYTQTVPTFNADGSLFGNQMWYSGRRGSSGHPANRLCIRDRDGKFIAFSAEENKELLGFAHNHETDYTAPLKMNFIVGSSHSKIAWYDSMKCPDDLPECWNQDRVRLLAAKTHKEFLDFSKQHQHCKLVLFPMVRWGVGREETHAYIPFGSLPNRTLHVIARESESLKPHCFYLPEIILYWKDGQRFEFIRVVIPPVGGKLLEPNESSPFSETFRWGKDSPGYHKVVAQKIPLERTFHTLKAKKQGTDAATTVTDSGYGRWERGKTYKDKEQLIVDFHTARNLVLVYDESRLDGNDTMNGPYALPPDCILSGLKERELIDSLPLC